MSIHKEGYISITISVLFTVLVSVLFSLCPRGFSIFHGLIISVLAITTGFIIYFFRIPKRKFISGENKIISPADGTIVAIEEVFEQEVLKENCRQISVFMSPLNVHVNRYSISGKVVYAKRHKGKYFVASHPKSSCENERTSVCVETPTGAKILFRQVAGALARRIVCYAEEGKEVKQNDEIGFIKFGSRVDIFLPLSAKVEVKIGDKVKNGLSSIAEL